MRWPVAMFLFFMSCAAQQRAAQIPRMTVAQVTELVPEKVADRESWATDVLAALDDQQLPADPETVCQVLAIIEQESGFHADPQVAGLPRMLRTELEKKVEKLGPLGRPALHELLSGKAPGSKRTFEERQTQSLTAILAFRDQHAPELSDRRVRADVLEEKTAALEGTDTWRAIKRVWARRNGVDAPYARLPEVTIKSPKLSQDRSTAWFAKNVNARYERCLKRP